MNGFMISTQDAPGIAARLLEATAARDVNAFPIYGLGDGTTGPTRPRWVRWAVPGFPVRAYVAK